MKFSSRKLMRILVGILACILGGVYAFTDQNDFKILRDFRDGLKNPELLKWPENGDDPCGPPAWPHVFCSHASRVTQIQVQNLGLEGPLPQNLNQLEQLENVGLQRNRFKGKLPTFSGLSNLQFAFLDFNDFDTIPFDFFDGLSSIRVLALDENPFNKTSGWTLPTELAACSQLVNFSCSGCNVVGPLPDFFGKFPSLESLRLSYNRLTGGIPSSFSGSMLQVLWLNDQDGDGMTGSIDVIGSMLGLTTVWLHGNHFTGPIPADIGRLTSLRELNLNRNRLVGLIPASLASMNLQLLDLNNNMFMGSIPKFIASNVSYAFNSFCQSDPGKQCAPQVNALLDFLHDVSYPERLASEWIGNDPCGGPWWGISCMLGKVIVVNLQKLGLNGTLSPSLGNLTTLLEIHLEGNNLHGTVPASLAQLRTLRLLNLSLNNFEPPLPIFRDGVRVITDGNPRLLQPGKPLKQSPSPPAQPRLPPSPSPSNGPSSDGDIQKPSKHAPSPSCSSSPKSPAAVNEQKKRSSKISKVVTIAIAAVVGTIAVVFLVALSVFCCLKKRRKAAIQSGGGGIHPNKSPETSEKGNAEMKGSASGVKSGLENAEAKLMISLQELRDVTKNFAKENELGRGGFGVVYMGEMKDGRKIAVKKMEARAESNRGSDGFQSEIEVLSKVRHRHLVSLIGYLSEDNERLLVYEYMPQGALSKHLFRKENPMLKSLSLMQRLTIALDVARGVEYLHSLAQHGSFIHRDLKPSNILLDDEFRAKVSDFGLVKLADRRDSSTIITTVVGTFGYIAPEYALSGRISSKTDVYSFGVVLMELLTGLKALDEARAEELRCLVEWFRPQIMKKDLLMASVDLALVDKEEDKNESMICCIAELARHCTNRVPEERPDMGHVVNVLSQLVRKWEPCKESDEFCGVDLSLPLSEMLQRWQREANSGGGSQDSEGSIPAKPMGFADSFTSADAR